MFRRTRGRAGRAIKLTWRIIFYVDRSIGASYHFHSLVIQCPQLQCWVFFFEGPRVKLKELSRKGRKMAKFEWFECPVCEYGTDKSSRYKAHVRSVHREIKDFECEQCDYKTDRNDRLMAHIRTVHDEKEPKSRFECDLCDYAASQKSGLSNHIKVVHLQLLKYKCEDCEYKAASKSMILRHKISKHDKIQDYKCDECPFASSFSHNLKKHMERIHGKGSQEEKQEGMQSHEQDEDTGAFLDKIGTLICNFCDFQTSRVHLLAIHVERCHFVYDDITATIHHRKESKKKFYCELCDFVASRKSGLSKHIKCIHLQLLQYKCENCEYSSNKKHYILRHKKAKHKKIKDQKCEASFMNTEPSEHERSQGSCCRGPRQTAAN